MAACGSKCFISERQWHLLPTYRITTTTQCHHQQAPLPSSRLSSGSSSLSTSCDDDKINVFASSPLPSSSQSHPSSSIIGCSVEWGRSTLVSFLLASALTSSIPAPSPSDTYQNVPSTISGADRPQRIQKPNSAKAETCTRKCVATCIRGGEGAPGEGPLNIRRPLVVFKEGFRSRQYCLVECSDICNLIGEGNDGP